MKKLATFVFANAALFSISMLQGQANLTLNPLNNELYENRSKLSYNSNTTTPKNTDYDLSQQIHTLLNENLTISDAAKNIQVSVYNGKVTLTGTVRNDKERRSIEKLVKEVNGVKGINNNLNVAIK